MGSGIRCNISKFADDIKIGRQISSEREAMVLQDELNKMHEWIAKWQINFDINKCSTRYIGRHNTRNRYTLNGADIGKSNSEKKDLGVLVSQNLRPREQRISEQS